MQVKGTVVSVEINVQVAKNGGGTYPGSRLTYRDDQGAIKEKAFHQNVFKFNKDLQAQLANLSAGNVFIMDMAKEGEFWNVKSILPEGAVSAKPTNDTPASGKATPYQAPKSTYETPEERAKKQVYIVRQSAINQAIAFNKDAKATVDAILGVAKQFEEYVFAEKAVVISEEFKGDEHEIY